MRIGFIAVLGVMAFSPPPCQKHNESFMNDDAGGTESSADTSGEAPTTHDETGASGTSSTDAEATDAVGATTDSAGETDDATSEATAESTGASDDGPCPAPEQLCGNTCIDTTTNDDHCGECGNKCHPVHQTCQDSVCVPN